MGYSGPAAPVPALTCVPADWWDPAWQAVKSPGATAPGPAICEPGEAAAPAAGATQPGTHPPKPAPSWGQVLATTFSLWASRHLPWLRRSPRRLLAASALGAGLVAVAVGTAGLAAAMLSPAPAAQLAARPSPIPAPSGRIDNLTDAAGSPAVPRGGAATGLGGTAPGGSVPQSAPWLATLAAGLLLVGAGGFGLRRSRRTAAAVHE